jgi:hypothetical protein
MSPTRDARFALPGDPPDGELGIMMAVTSSTCPRSRKRIAFLPTTFG